MTNKKVKDVLNGAHYATETKSGYATIAKSEYGIDESGQVFGGEIVMSFSQSMMPPHDKRIIPATKKDVENAMKDVANLSKWKYQGG